MDFRCAQPLVDTIVDRAHHGIFGYTDPSPELEDKVLSRLSSVYGCPRAPCSTWLRWIPGLIGGLNSAVGATCSQATDAVAVATPVYAPFLEAPRKMGARLIEVPLAESRRGVSGDELHYSIDWQRLEAAVADPHTKLVLCAIRTTPRAGAGHGVSSPASHASAWSMTRCCALTKCGATSAGTRGAPVHLDARLLSTAEANGRRA